MLARARVEVLGIRHHGPGSARSTLAALEELQPDLLLIEGPPELDALVSYAADPGLVPPVAALVYAVDAPHRALFYPFALFSPEWVALRWAIEHGVEVRFADLPATHLLAEADTERVTASAGGESRDGASRDGEPDAESGPRPAGITLERRPDPIEVLARAAGYDDPERWWEDAVEHRRSSTLEDFAQLRAAMADVRAAARDARRDAVDERVGESADAAGAGEDGDLENARREASMRAAIRAAVRQGRERIAFVCGAYHAPALEPASFPSAGHDAALLRGLPKAKVAATWAPWTAGRLAQRSGYGAGVRSPGWYQHLFVTPDDEVVPAWFVRVARTLREEGLDASTASVVEATRLAEVLAGVRGRPSVGLAELTDAARAVLADGSDLPLQLIDRSLVIGEELGQVPESVPMVPLASDLARQQKGLRLRPSPTSTVVSLDLRRESQLARSVLLHRLDLLEIPWGTPVDAGRTMGTFKEAWALEWTPELAVSVIEASLHGTTVESAAVARVAEAADEATDLASLGSLIEQCLLADLAGGLRAVVATLAHRSARQHDTLALLGAIEPLARTCRYGDVRGVDVSGVAHVLQTVVVRAAVGLRAAASGLDDDGSARLRTAIEAAHRGVALLDDDSLRTPWNAALAAVAADEALHGAVPGLANRLLLDAGELDADEAARRLSRQLSSAAGGPAAAAWLDGFLAGEALLLLHTDELLAIIDDWLVGITETSFEDVLPLVRRTFARYAPAERRLIGQRLREGGILNRAPGALSRIDVERAAPAVATVARLLGLGATA
ncbi:hypothetical protein N865_20630 [Intrasporangium oryzae NRRL B-24470]|uniref:Uncharacterized protein n=2 Tax=Intrasporangium TaxID=53357 RepID=W9GDU2_9MICO|nr:hypothetical protein N865_20630 [Intrasporangium oryzae NRRL B-24470]